MVGWVWASSLPRTPNAVYPSTDAGRTQLANDLAAGGWTPTQGKQHFDRAKIAAMADAMRDGSFDWDRAGLQPVILGPAGEVIGGHHRIVAACLAGIDLTAVSGPRPQVQRLPKNFRPEHAWADVLPDTD